MTLKKHHEEIANTFADKMYANEIKHAERVLADRIENNPRDCEYWQEIHNNKMKQLTPDFIERFKERMRSDCRDLISEIQEQLGWLTRVEAEKAENLRKKAEAEQEAKAAELSNYKDHLINRVRVIISGAELVELARMLDIEVHPRTAGVLQRSVLEIRNCDSMRVYGKKTSTDGAWSLLRQVIATIDDMNEPVLSPEEAKKVDEVFA